MVPMSFEQSQASRHSLGILVPRLSRWFYQFHIRMRCSFLFFPFHLSAFDANKNRQLRGLLSKVSLWSLPFLFKKCQMKEINLFWIYQDIAIKIILFLEKKRNNINPSIGLKVRERTLYLRVLKTSGIVWPSMKTKLIVAAFAIFLTTSICGWE